MDKPNYFFKALNHWIDYYNSSYLHSTLGYMPPEKFENEFNQKQQERIIYPAPDFKLA